LQPSVDSKETGLKAMEPRNFTGFEGRHSLSMGKATSLSAVKRVDRDFGGVKIGPIMFHNDYRVNWGEPGVSPMKEYGGQL